MFEVIRDWFATDIITVLNTTVATALSETDRDLDTELLPAGQKDYHYTLQIGDVEELNLEAEQYRVSCVCKLSFIANTKDVSNYESYLDDYVFPIVRLLKRYSTGIDTSGISFNEVELGSIKANLNAFEDNYFKPQIEFTVKVIDSVDMSLSVPSAPTLTSPSNGSTSGLTDQSFNWTGTADTWNFVLLNGTTEVINQDGLIASSFTVPADSLLTDGTTYTWKVRGKNEAGYGSFSSVFSFTVNDTGFDTDFTNWLSGLTGAQPSSARQTLMNTFITGLKSDGIWNKLDALWLIANETEEQGKKNLKANKFNLVPINSPTFTVDRGYSTNGTTQYIRTGTAPKYQNNYTQNNASFGLYVNTNVDQNAVDMGNTYLSYNLLYTRLSNATYTAINDGGSTPSTANATSIGFYAVDRQASANYKVYKNGVALVTQSIVSTGVTDFEFFIGARNNIGTADRFASKRYALAFIGGGLSATEHANFYTRVNTLLTAIGAN